MTQARDRVDSNPTPERVQTLFGNSQAAGKWPPVLTVDQAASLLGIAKSTLYEWRGRGRLKGCCRKRGKHLRFLRDRLIQTFFFGKEWS